MQTWVAVCDMLHSACREGRKGKSSEKAKAMDASFIQHIKQGHVPFRRDCQFCVRGGGKRRQHKRVLCPEGWCLSVDTAGPYRKAPDEGGRNAKYMVVGVLTIPILELKGGVEVEDDQEEDVAADAGGALSDEEIFADGEDEKDPDLSAKEINEAKTNRATWEEIVKRDQEAWKVEAEQEHLPRVKVVEWVFVESLPGKSQQHVLEAVKRMQAQALHLGFDVRRLHSDRGREYNNAALKAWCADHAIVKTLAFAEERQGNGRVEATIGRIKSLTRTYLEQGAAPPEEWPLAVQLAAQSLQNRSRVSLGMPRRPMVPYNTKVQVVQRTWRRGAWHAVTVSAFTKGPSTDNDRGWVVVTSDGNFLTTSKMFPSPDVEKKVVVTYEGDPIDPDAPSKRVRGKTAAKRLVPEMALGEPGNEVDRLAASLLSLEDFSSPAVARLALAISKCSGAMQGSLPTPAEIRDKERGALFFSGGFSYGGITGLKTQMKEFPWTTAYLASYLRKFSSSPFAAVGLVWNAEHVPHRDLHNQKGVQNVVVPVVTSGGGLWVQEEGLSSEQCVGEVVKTEVKEGLKVDGRVLWYKPGKPVTFYASKWHSSVKSEGQQLLVVGYTPRSLHKLDLRERRELWNLGFTFLPATQDEYWTLDCHRCTITRHHKGARRPLFVPRAQDVPFPLCRLGNIRYCEQKFSDGSVSKHMNVWRQANASVAIRAKWTGRSVFQFVVPNQDCEDLGGGPPTEFIAMQPGRKKLCKVCEDELPEGYGFGRCNGCGILQGLSDSGNLVQTVHGGVEGMRNPALRSSASGVQGPEGASGVQGPKGASGVQGPEGASGVQGPEGASGVQGRKGASGVQGPEGASGVQGPEGASGVQGPEGASGVQGPEGASGVQGLKGASGVQGPEGASGVQGLEGASGVQGPEGASGVQGLKGASGVQGPEGASGVQGPEGASGVQGPEGAPGVQGVEGAPGAQGPNSASGVQSSEGTSGVQGVGGASGVQGPGGASGVQGFVGALGMQGSTGMQSSKGELGVQTNSNASCIRGSERSEGSLSKRGTWSMHESGDVLDLQGSDRGSQSVVGPRPGEDTRVTGDTLELWYLDDHDDEGWERCRYLVPEVAAELRACACTPSPEQQFWLESVPWKMKLDVEQEAVDLAAEHRFRSQILEALEDDSESQAGRAEVAAELAKLCALEVQVKRCADAAWNLVVEKGSAIVEGEDKLAVGYSLKTTPAVRAVGQQDAGDDTKEVPVPTEEEFLQTRLVSTEEVKRNLAEWISPMKEEYDSLVQTTGTCHPLAQEEFDAVTQDPTAAVEVLPGKLVFSIKAKSGKKKARIVGCGNHQQGPSREKD